MQCILIVPLIASTLALGGCVPMMAVSAVSMVARSAARPAQSNAHLAPTAEAACSAQAARFGTVYVIDVQQKGAGKIIVWGTAGAAPNKQSFECHFGTQITAFKLRPIQNQ